AVFIHPDDAAIFIPRDGPVEIVVEVGGIKAHCLLGPHSANTHGQFVDVSDIDVATIHVDVVLGVIKEVVPAFAALAACIAGAVVFASDEHASTWIDVAGTPVQDAGPLPVPGHFAPAFQSNLAAAAGVGTERRKQTVRQVDVGLCSG